MEFSGLDSIRPDDFIPKFRIDFEIASLGPEEPRSCWNGVVGNSVLVVGFPIAQRLSDDVGLAIPLEVMANLAGIPLATNYGGGYVLRGRSHIFVPVERRGETVQWHLIEKPEGRIQFRDLEELCARRVLADELDEEALLTTKAFLGWCPKLVHNLGKYKSSTFLLY